MFSASLFFACNKVEYSEPYIEPIVDVDLKNSNAEFSNNKVDKLKEFEILMQNGIIAHNEGLTYVFSELQRAN